MLELDVSLFRALERSHDTWSVHTTHTEDAQAFSDRTLMAAEINRLRTELAAALDTLGEADEEVRQLRQQLDRIDF